VGGDDDDDGVSCEKGKAVDGPTTKQKREAMDAFVNHGFLDEERAQVDFILLRPIPGETPSPTAQLNEMHNLEEIGAIRKGVVPQSMRNQRLTIGVSDLEFGTLLIF